MDLVIPTESFLRKHFLRFGRIIDIKVRDYSHHMVSTLVPPQRVWMISHFECVFDRVERNKLVMHSLPFKMMLLPSKQ